MQNTLVNSSLIRTNNVILHVMQAGNESNPAVILLHGFPEFWYGWHRQIDPLVEAGFRVIIPDQRGYNLSDKPTDTNNYKTDILVKDITGLIDALGLDKVHLVGHDWGGYVAWAIAINHPERINKLVVANAPHPYVLSQAIPFADVLKQTFKSWYFGLFNTPLLPEFLISANDYSLLAGLLKDDLKLTDNQVNMYKLAWRQPHALTGMLNWYRAFMVTVPGTPENIRVTVPTRIIWGKRDIALAYEMAEHSLKLCDDGELFPIEQSGHFVQHNATAQFNQLLLEFLSN